MKWYFEGLFGISRIVIATTGAWIMLISIAFDLVPPWWGEAERSAISEEALANIPAARWTTSLPVTYFAEDPPDVTVTLTNAAEVEDYLLSIHSYRFEISTNLVDWMDLDWPRWMDRKAAELRLNEYLQGGIADTNDAMAFFRMIEE